MYTISIPIILILMTRSRIVNADFTTPSYVNWTTPEQRDLDYAEMLTYRNTMMIGRVHANGDKSPEEETRERLSSIDSIWQEMCVTTDATDLASLSDRMHSKVSNGKCAICIQRRGYDGRINALLPDITYNFKDVKGESNWNSEILINAFAQDCTTEKISHGRQLKLVQVFGNVEIDHCVCNLHISCSYGIAKFSNAWINLNGKFLVQHYKLQYPASDPSVGGKCPPNCVMFGPFFTDGLKGMNVYRDALNCPENDDACKHKLMEMW